MKGYIADQDKYMKWNFGASLLRRASEFRLQWRISFNFSTLVVLPFYIDINLSSGIYYARCHLNGRSPMNTIDVRSVSFRSRLQYWLPWRIIPATVTHISLMAYLERCKSLLFHLASSLNRLLIHVNLSSVVDLLYNQSWQKIAHGL